jgi:hypothetical protein
MILFWGLKKFPLRREIPALQDHLTFLEDYNRAMGASGVFSLRSARFSGTKLLEGNYPLNEAGTTPRVGTHKKTHSKGSNDRSPRPLESAEALLWDTCSCCACGSREDGGGRGVVEQASKNTTSTANSSRPRRIRSLGEGASVEYFQRCSSPFPENCCLHSLHYGNNDFNM